MHVAGPEAAVCELVVAIYCIKRKCYLIRKGRMAHKIARSLGFVTLVVVMVAAHADEIKLRPLVSGLSGITSIANAGDERLFIVEQTGLVRVFDGERLLDEPLLDVRSQISCCAERGLLSLAFHPRFKENGLLFVCYTDTIGRVTVERYQIFPDDPNRANESSATPIMQILHLQSGHNAGQLAFGPDGYLYVSIGDGNGNGDAENNAQDLTRYLGKILRIDVDHGDPYSIPDTNPFLGRTEDVIREIWAYGLRNPWRFSFDRKTGDLFIADVGDSSVEEIDFQPAGSAGGQNYGWNLMEGPECRAGKDCSSIDPTLPVLFYYHDEGCAVIGGYRYRGTLQPSLYGMYFYADYCTGRILSATQSPDGTWHSQLAGKADARIRTFGEDAAGELLVGTEDGTVWRISTNEPRVRSFRAR